MSDKIDYKPKTVIRKKGHYIMIKGSIQQKYISFVNIYASNIGAPKHVKQNLTDLKGETDSNTILVGDFKTPLSTMDRSSRQKINKKTLDANDTLDQMDSGDIYRTFQKQ